MSAGAQNGLIHLATKHSVDEAMQRLEALLTERGITIFARVDHSGEAAKVGLDMRPTKLLIFGSPKGGTPLMQATPTVAIDLPLKALFLGRRLRQGMAHLQRSAISRAAPQLPDGAVAQHRGCERSVRQSR